MAFDDIRINHLRDDNAAKIDTLLRPRPPVFFLLVGECVPIPKVYQIAGANIAFRGILLFDRVKSFMANLNSIYLLLLYLMVVDIIYH